MKHRILITIIIGFLSLFGVQGQDTDGDGIPNGIDLDDDNDGILDIDELECIIISVPATFNPNTQAWQSSGVTMNAGSFYEIISFGTNLGNRIANGGPNSGQSVTQTRFAGNRYSDHDGNMYFISDNSYIATTPPGGSTALGFANLPANAATQLTYAGMIDVNGNGQYDPGIDELIPDVFSESGNIRIVPSVTGDFHIVYIDSAYGDNSGILSFEIRFCDIVTDTDGDGVFNVVDLDSDNDGIYDAVEAGHDLAHSGGILTGSVGADGIPDSIQDSGQEDSGIINYSYLDSDVDNINDNIQLDSDNDGCNDVDEAGYTDNNNDGLLGPNPITVDSNGLVTSGSDGYTTPNDTAGAFDYRTVPLGAISINTQPTNQNVFAGDNATFTISSSNTNTYQWQVSSDGGGSFITISDDTMHSGTTTTSLTIIAPDIDKDGYLYRVLISNTANNCIVVISDQAILTMQVRTVISNRRITKRVNKN